MSDDLELHRQTTVHGPTLRSGRARRRGRPSLGRPARVPAGRRAQRTIAPAPQPTLSERERDRRLALATRALVRTIQACPAPGVPPLRTRDWLALGAVVLVPALVVFALAAWASR
jgi:hypothetical protein